MRKNALAETELQIYVKAVENSISCFRSTKQAVIQSAATSSEATVNTCTIVLFHQMMLSPFRKSSPT